MLEKISIFIFLLFFIFLPALANTNNNIIINEIAWMGTTASSNNEWIELYNPTDNDISIDGWTLTWDGGNINLTGEIKANGYFLLERSDDDSVSDITADKIYTGSLSNAGEDLVLKNTQSEIVDSAIFASGWPAGDNEKKLTMQRKCELNAGNNADSWQNSSTKGGTPKAKNNCSATPPSCKSQEISRECVNDGLAEVTFSYQDPACGDDFISEQTDQSCAFKYTEWTNQECTGDNLRLQTQEELSGFAYCDKILSREIEDNSCQLNNSINISGRACWLENYQWKCDREAQIKTSDEEITLTIPQKEVNKTFSLREKNDFLVFTIYQAQITNTQFTLIINNKTKRAIAFGSGFHFRGRLEN